MRPVLSSGLPGLRSLCLCLTNKLTDPRLNNVRLHLLTHLIASRSLDLQDRSSARCFALRLVTCCVSVCCWAHDERRARRFALPSVTGMCHPMHGTRKQTNAQVQYSVSSKASHYSSSKALVRPIQISCQTVYMDICLVALLGLSLSDASCPLLCPGTASTGGTERMSGRDTIDVPWSRFMFRNLGLQVQTNSVSTLKTSCWIHCKEEHRWG
jgi:hypothetical protein